jgi:S-adenosylmethionine:tRNA ribosyltransferase-isomerase
VLVKPATRARRGVVVRVGNDAIRITLRKPGLGTDMWLARVDHTRRLSDLLERYGTRTDPMLKALGNHRQSYQNVYARKPGSLEVPSAGLHFTPELLAGLKSRGVLVAPITLHTGLTEMSLYRRISAKEVEDHRVAEEWYEVSGAAARAINGARRRGGRVVAVGTTVVRSLETATDSTTPTAKVKAGSGWTDLYVRPGYAFRMVDMMLTNLHQPRSSHLVAAFAGVDFTARAYRQLVGASHRFDLFGDSMLLF